MRRIRGKLADHVGDHVVSSPEGTILVTFPGTKSLYPRPPQSLNIILVKLERYSLTTSAREIKRVVMNSLTPLVYLVCTYHGYS